MNTFGPRRVKPGWYVLSIVTLYAVVVTALLLSRGGAAASVAEPEVVPESAANTKVDVKVAAPAGMWFPVPGARLPAGDENLPGAPRAYRHGVSQGFDFYDGDAGVPITTGTPVVAALPGQVIRADTAYSEIDPRAWELLLADVAEEGADEEQLDRLRGRQLWIRAEDGTVIRYGHLAGVRDGVRPGNSVYRGQVVGFVGNSGTDQAVAGSEEGARLRFEIWDPNGEFFGSGLTPTEVRLAASSLFVGP